MIADIRAYFHERITALDPSLSAWETDLFGNNDQSKPRADKFYNLIIGVNNSDRDSNSHVDQIEVTLDIYASESRDIITAFDNIYDTALDIKNCIIDTKQYLGTFRFNDIEFISATPLEEDTNDNSIKIRLEFTVRRNFTID